jgi:hypothetical protein
MINESVRYGVRWFGVVGLSMAMSVLNKITIISDIKLDIYIYCFKEFTGYYDSLN